MQPLECEESARVPLEFVSRGKGQHEDDREDDAMPSMAEGPERPVQDRAISDWDMPDDGDAAKFNIEDFTLGDIRQAEKAISKGVSLSEYKSSLHAERATKGDTASEDVDLSHALEAQPLFKGEAEDPFRVDPDSGSPVFFFEEEREENEDSSDFSLGPQGASRGFGKWFRQPCDKPDTSHGGRYGQREEGIDGEEDEEDLWDMPASSSAAFSGSSAGASAASSGTARVLEATSLSPSAPVFSPSGDKGSST